jgi:uncharacterized membrane protein
VRLSAAAASVTFGGAPGSLSGGHDHPFREMASENGLNALVQQAEQLTADITEASGELPHVHRNLYQIHEAGQRLLEKTAGVRDGKADVKAAILLGSRGFDVPKLSQKLESLNAAKSLEAIEPVWETDIEVTVFLSTL